MKPEDLPEAKLAWMISQRLEELSQLLWKRYEDEFLSFVMEEEDQDWESTIGHETE